MHLLSVPVARIAMIIVAVFVIDCLTPLGIAAGALYIAAVLASVAVHNRRAIYVTAITCTLLVLVGIYFSPGQGQMEWWKVLINRVLDIGAVWVTAGMADVWTQVQQRRFKEVLESRLLHQATALSASQQSLRDALETSLRTLCDIVGWPAGHVYLRDNSGQYLVAHDVWYTGNNVVFELLRAATRGRRFSREEGAVGRAWSLGEPMAVADVCSSADYAWLKEPERLDIAGAFLLPVTVGGKVVAMMEFFSSQPIHVDAEFMPLARNVGEQLGRLFERRKAEQTIRRSEERLRLALQGGGMGTWEWHMDSGQVIWSPELEEIHGLAPGTFEGTLEAMQQEVHPDDRARVSEAISEAFGKNGEYRIEYRIIRPDGNVQWLEGRGAVQEYADGSSRRMVGVCMNVTERKKYDEQNARLASIVQSSDDAILAKALDGTILSWNGGAERIYGYRADEIIGQPVSILSPPDRKEDFANIMGRIALGERIDHFETVRQRRDGQIIDISLSVSPIRNSAGVVIGASSVSRDITDRKQVEREMQEAREKAETANRLQSRFLANMSHELRTPMNSILGMLQLSLGDNLASKVRSWLETAQTSANSLLALLNDLLDFSKMEAGRLAVQPAPFRLASMVDDVIQALAPKAFEKGLELICRVEPHVPDEVVGDAMRIRQVLTNLVTNAIKFTVQGEVVLRVECEKRSEDVAMIRFTVTDTGTGIAQEDQRRIFEPFIQSDATTTNQQGGAGLGLAICRELVRRMGGELQLESELGEGSRFWFSLLLNVTESGSRDTPGPVDPSLLDGVSVLVADRSEASRQMLQATFHRLDIACDWAVDYDHLIGKLYRAEIEGNRVRLVVVDVKTMSMSSAALLIHLGQSLTEVPALVVMTRSANELTEEEEPGEHGEHSSRVVYLNKPVSPTRLLRAAGEALGVTTVEPIPRDTSAASPAPTRHLSVLLAEDTRANQEVIIHALDRRGHQVTVVQNGEEALSAFEKCTFDTILMDVTMPVMNGYEATRAIRRREETLGLRPTPIIALTAHALEEDREMCRAAGMNAYLAKPIDVTQLIHTIESFACAQRPLGGDLITVDSCGSDSIPDDRFAVDSSPPLSAPPLESSLGSEPLDTADLSDVIDYQGALQRMGGDEDLFRDCVRIFDQDAPGLLEDLSHAVTQLDAERLLRGAQPERAGSQFWGAGSGRSSHSAGTTCPLPAVGRNGGGQRIFPA